MMNLELGDGIKDMACLADAQVLNSIMWRKRNEETLLLDMYGGLFFEEVYL